MTKTSESLAIINRAIEQGNLDKPALIKKNEYHLRKFYEDNLEDEYQEHVATVKAND